MAWLTGWNYRKPITISNSGSSLTDYQTSITIDTASLVTAGKLLSNCNDIRFTSSDGSTLLSYWIESGINSPATKIWVKIPSIANGNNTIYIYYNNLLAAAVSNGRDTFVVFDDFATGSSEQWTVSGVTSDRTTNHRLNINGATGSTSAYLDKGADIGDYEFLYTYTRTSGAAAGFGVGTGDQINNNIDAPISNASAVLDHPTSIGGQNKYLRVYQAGTNYGTYIVAGAGNTLYYGKLTRLNNVYTYTVYSDAARTSQVWSISSTRAGLINQRYIYAVLTTIDFVNTATGWLKDIRIRKLVSTEPTTCIGGEEVQTPSWLSGWNRRKLMTITGSTNVQTDYQMKLTVHKSTGTDTSTDIYLGTNVNNDFSDLRFTSSDGSTVLNYWIESYTSGSVATVWIKIPSVPVGPCTTTIYLYYNNTLASIGSDGNNTFDFFDDFNGSSIDTNKWTISGTPSVSGSNLNINSAEGITSVNDLSSTNVEVVTLMRVNSATYGTAVRETHIGIDININWYTTIGFIGYAYGGIYGSYIRDATSETYGMWRSFTLGTYYRVSGRYGAITTYGTIDGASYSHPKVVSGSNKKISIKEDNWAGGSSDADFDWIFVRKYTSPEPTFLSIGTEEVLALPANITATNMTITPSSSPCIEGSCTVTVDVTWTNTGETSGSFTPSIKIDNVTVVVSPPLTPVLLGPSLTASQQFIITGMTTGTHTICPDPN